MTGRWGIMQRALYSNRHAQDLFLYPIHQSPLYLDETISNITGTKRKFKPDAYAMEEPPAKRRKLPDDEHLPAEKLDVQKIKFSPQERMTDLTSLTKL